MALTPNRILDQALRQAATSPVNPQGLALAMGPPPLFMVPAPQIQLHRSHTMVPGSWAGLLKQGNIDLNRRPRVRNTDGSISTVRSITVTDNQGRAYLLPTVIGNRVVSNDQAIQHFKQTGQHLGFFQNEALADQYAQALHLQQAKHYVP